jgi:hypothetical protein
MSEASCKPNTKPPEHLGQLIPTSCAYVGADEVLISLKTDVIGETVTFSLTTKMLVKLVNQSVDLINNSSAQVFRDLGVM